MNSRNFIHLDWLNNDTSQQVKLSTGQIIDVWFFEHKDEQSVMSQWANHFRNHYCEDEELEIMIKGEGLSKQEYLTTRKFPDQSNRPGPSIRSGDFSEILVADFLEHILEYEVPRTRYDRKSIPNESTKGSDLIGFKFKDNNAKPSSEDELIVYEVKAKFSGNKSSGKERLQDAVDDSIKDEIRLSESLYAMKTRLWDKGDKESFKMIERFQNIVDRPYNRLFGAAALYSTHLYDSNRLKVVDTSKHPNDDNLKLLIIYGDDMMDLVHDLYRRAADEA